jgi:hypothetical protein
MRIGDELARIGIHGAFEGALRYVGNPALVTRAHFARYLVEIGVAKNVHDVFLHYLARGKPGYVEHVWATLEDAVGWIKGAGGLAVIAHPGRYRLSCAEMNMLFEQFRDLRRSRRGSCGAHDGGQLLAFARMAQIWSAGLGRPISTARKTAPSTSGGPPRCRPISRRCGRAWRSHLVC